MAPTTAPIPETGPAAAEHTPRTQPRVLEDDAWTQVADATIEELEIFVQTGDAFGWVEWEDDLWLAIDGVLRELLLDDVETL